MTNSNLIDKKGALSNFLLYIKWIIQLIIKEIEKKAKYYYGRHKERLREQARGKYRNFSEEDKKKKREYGQNRYHDMPEDKKQKLKEYQKEHQEKYREAKKA